MIRREIHVCGSGGGLKGVLGSLVVKGIYCFGDMNEEFGVGVGWKVVVVLRGCSVKGWGFM